MRRLALFAALGIALACGPGVQAQKLPWQTSDTAGANGGQLVRFLFPQQVVVAAGKPQAIEMHFRIAGGFHINSHVPLQKSLIRTDLTAPDSPGVKIGGVDFPPGSSYAFPADPSQKLSVYTGELVVRMHVVAQRGNHLIQGSLRYQACDTNTCFPPRNVPAAVDVIAQ